MTLSKTTLAILIILLLILVTGYSSVYTVAEGQRALLLRLGSIVTHRNTDNARVIDPGLHWKLPFITNAVILDTRLQTLNIQAARMITVEQKDIIVDYYVKWRINNLAQYFMSTGNDQQQTSLLLTQQLNDGLRAQFGRRTIGQIVSADRAAMMDAVTLQANANAQKLGVSIVDVRIKRIDLPNEISNAVFERMRTERERIAAEYRATGKSNAEAIRANADANVTITIATAKAQAATIRAQGDEQAAKIYADAYSKDPAFYGFLRSLDAYKKIFNNTENNMLVLRPDSQFFKYFNNQDGQAGDQRH